ncbi:MAG: ABC transporter substrate-binding protein [Rhodocyclaceae bacterium]|nr:ABC transporter substrate-binding protein [Rhodocyclaceae bacterium]
MKTTIVQWLAATAFSLAASLALAGPGPEALTKQLTEEVIAAVEADAEIRAGDTEKAIRLVEERVLPHFNFGHMTALAVGRDWRGASPEQRDALTEQFRTLLVRTYSNALTQYDNQTIAFKPFRGRPGDRDAQVRTEIRQPGAQAIQMDFSLELVGEDWKVYDVVVAGVSLVTNYRASFSQQVRQSGIDGLIESLRAKNDEMVPEKS